MIDNMLNMKTIIESVDNTIIIDHDRKKVIKYPRNYGISRIKFMNETNRLKELSNLNIVPKLYLLHDDYIEIEYLEDVSEKNPVEVFHTLQKLYNFYGISPILLNRDYFLERIRNLVQQIGKKTINPVINVAITSMINHLQNETEYLAHKTIIHGSLFLRHIKKDEKGNLKLIDWGDSREGFIEEEIGFSKAEDIMFSEREGYNPLSVKNFYNELEKLLYLNGLVDKNTITIFSSLKHLERIPYLYLYESDPKREHILRELSALNAINELDKEDITTVPYNIKPKKILFISWGPQGSVGGVTTYLNTIKEFLERYGFKFYEIATYENPNKPGKILYFIKDENGKWIDSDEKDVIKYVSNLNVDIIDVNNFSSGVIFDGKKESLIEIIKKNVGKPLIYTLHVTINEIIPDIENPYVKSDLRCIKESSIVVGNSYILKNYIRTFPEILKNKRIIEINQSSKLYTMRENLNETDMNDFLKQFNIQNSWRLLYHGRITEDKGIREIIDAVKILSEEYGKNNIFLLVTGKIRPRANSIEEIYGGKLPENVLYLGPLSEEKLVMTLETSHIVTQPTYYDSFNISLLEGLMFIKPVITFEVYAPKYYFVDKYKVAKGVKWSEDYKVRVERLKNAIYDVIINYEKYRKTVTSGLKNLVKNHSVAKFVIDYINLYSSL